MIGCAGFASRALEIRTATMASAENATDVISRRVRPSKARSENRQPPTKSTKESAKVAALEKELERYRQAEKRSEFAQQETDAPTKAAHKKAIRDLDYLPTTTRQSKRSKQDWTKQRRPVTNPCPSARGSEQARTRSPCMRETSKRPTIECKRPSRASWLLSKAWNSTEPRLWRSQPVPIVGCAREPRCWVFAQSTSMDERWRQLMQCTEREILGGCDILGDEARGHMGRGLTPRWVIRKVAPAKSYNRPRMARDTRWWRALSNRLRELWLMEALPTRRPHLPQQPELIEWLRVHLRRMANEARAEKDCAEIWEMATQEYGEPELQVLKDVHWRALTVLDKLHKRDRRVREKIDRGIRERGFQGGSGFAASPHKATPSLVPQRRGARGGDQPARCGGTGSQELVTHLAGAR